MGGELGPALVHVGGAAAEVGLQAEQVRVGTIRAPSARIVSAEHLVGLLIVLMRPHARIDDKTEYGYLIWLRSYGPKGKEHPVAFMSGQVGRYFYSFGISSATAMRSVPIEGLTFPSAASGRGQSGNTRSCLA